MSDSSSAPVGIIAGLRAAGDCLLGSVQDRLALLALEIEEEKLHVVRLLAWIAAAIVTGVMVLVSASATLLYFFWATSPLAALLGLLGLHAGALALVLLGLRRTLLRQPRPFTASIAELEVDRRCLRQEE